VVVATQLDMCLSSLGVRGDDWRHRGVSVLSLHVYTSLQLGSGQRGVNTYTLNGQPSASEPPCPLTLFPGV